MKINKNVSMFLIYTMIILVGISVGFKSSDFSKLNADNSITVLGSEFSPDFSARKLTNSDNNNYTYTYTFSRDSLDKIGSDNFGIILYRMADNAHKIYINDVLIGSKGDFIDGRSNLWNGINEYEFNIDQLQDINTIRIDTYAIYHTGMTKYPIYITDYELATEVTASIKFYGEQSILVAIGFIFFSTLLTGILSFASPEKPGKFIFSSLASIFTVLYFIDYVSYNSIIFSYIFYKKITMAGIFLGFSFFALSLSRYFNSRLLVIMASVTSGCYIVTALVTSTMPDFKYIYTYLYLLLLVMVLTIVIIAFTNLKKVRQSYIFLVTFIVVGIYASLAVYLDIAGGFFKFNSPVIYIIAVASMPLILVYDSFVEKELIIVNERNLREIEFLNAVTDKLTGLRNQRYLMTVLESEFHQFTIALIDLDDFKFINDTCGHSCGDYVLKTIGNIIKDNIKEDDVACRYGGDEFAVLLYECGSEEAYDTLERIRIIIENYNFQFKSKMINVTISAGIQSIDESHSRNDLFSLADKHLYTSKHNGKNRVMTSS